ncbi:MAG: hypothetical protein U9R27_03410 [Campylobacterota bacterium]|nr:hypothetical protein [Campylobacterota bacterium]
MDKENLYRLQIIQDTISVYLGLPIRIMRGDALSISYRLISKDSKLFINNNIQSESDFSNFIIELIDDIPNLYDTISNSKIEGIKNRLDIFHDIDMKELSKKIFLTYGSFHPKLYRKLKQEKPFFTFAMLLAIYVSAKHNKNTKDPVKLERNFSFDTTKFNNDIVILGPYCQDEKFDIFIKNIVDTSRKRGLNEFKALRNVIAGVTVF